MERDLEDDGWAWLFVEQRVCEGFQEGDVGCMYLGLVSRARAAFDVSAAKQDAGCGFYPSPAAISVELSPLSAPIAREHYLLLTANVALGNAVA
jgi:hypothetical protein